MIDELYTIDELTAKIFDMGTIAKNIDFICSFSVPSTIPLNGIDIDYIKQHMVTKRTSTQFMYNQSIVIRRDAIIAGATRDARNSIVYKTLVDLANIAITMAREVTSKDMVLACWRLSDGLNMKSIKLSIVVFVSGGWL